MTGLLPDCSGRTEELLARRSPRSSLLSPCHDPYLVALSILVASFASYTALDLGGLLEIARALARRVWPVAAAITGGIWSMPGFGPGPDFESGEQDRNGRQMLPGSG